MASPRSKKMADKSKFLDKYNECSDEIKNLLDEITRQLISRACLVDWGYTNSPDLRFSCAGQGFCKFVLRPPYQMIMYIRVDDLAYAPTLEKVGLAEKFFVATNSGFKGKKWIETGLDEKTQLPPLMSIIDALSNDRILNGW